ncbi:hypothetical protein CC86DRAFT_400632 [Ophiobolus disseminans]|uniref:Uncharacterized protein n=1 Tax=Ophiobolus disseminans TaxID=1469910 RepID=A0A6A7AGQ3_9PLEO|nr:hypothetical protein CC86DRAFT_400632 [Ophiobolus disseminans]
MSAGFFDLPRELWEMTSHLALYHCQYTFLTAEYKPPEPKSGAEACHAFTRHGVTDLKLQSSCDTPNFRQFGPGTLLGPLSTQELHVQLLSHTPVDSDSEEQTVYEDDIYFRLLVSKLVGCPLVRLRVAVEALDSSIDFEVLRAVAALGGQLEQFVFEVEDSVPWGE